MAHNRSDDTMRPVVFITGDPGAAGSDARQLGCPLAYATAVADAGGLPVVLPPSADLALVGCVRNRCDGLLFTGGSDLTSDAYGAPPHPECKPVHTMRQEWDLELMRQALAWQDMPILAICLGAQELNVATGGTLHQHLPEIEGRLEHRRLDADERFHPVSVTAGTALAEVLGRCDIISNTSHHQGLDRVGSGLRVVARAPDGTVEAVEPETPSERFLLGIQWHPERIAHRPPHDRIFTAFVTACRKRLGIRCKTPLPPRVPCPDMPRCSTGGGS